MGVHPEPDSTRSPTVWPAPPQFKANPYEDVWRGARRQQRHRSADVSSCRTRSVLHFLAQLCSLPSWPRYRPHITDVESSLLIINQFNLTSLKYFFNIITQGSIRRQTGFLHSDFAYIIVNVCISSPSCMLLSSSISLSLI
jgi:hypothetical protein